MERTVQ